MRSQCCGLPMVAKDYRGQPYWRCSCGREYRRQVLAPKREIPARVVDPELARDIKRALRWAGLDRATPSEVFHELRLRGSASNGKAVSRYRLSERQREVAELMLSGLATEAALAQALKIDRNAAGFHLQRVGAKLDRFRQVRAMPRSQWVWELLLALPHGQRAPLVLGLGLGVEDKVIEGLMGWFRYEVREGIATGARHLREDLAEPDVLDIAS